MRECGNAIMREWKKGKEKEKGKGKGKGEDEFVSE